MSATTFLTQRQLMTKNMPASALDNPFAKQQKVLLYVLPIVFAVSGVNFPIGVLIYWFTTNVWSMCQQFYVIRRMPAPGSAAEKAYHARLERKGKPIPGADVAKAKADAEAAEVAELAKQSGQRQQPASKKRKKNKAAGAKPAGQAAPAGAQTAPSRASRTRPHRRARTRPHRRRTARSRTDPTLEAGKKTGNAAKPPTT